MTSPRPHQGTTRVARIDGSVVLAKVLDAALAPAREAAQRALPWRSTMPLGAP